MTQSRTRQGGFTLIEIAVVVVILATISAISLFAINQAFDRRFISQADNLLVWLNQLSDQAALEAVPYGVIDRRDEARKSTDVLKVVAYFRQHWLPVSYPESFAMEKGARIEWIVSADDTFDEDYNAPSEDEDVTVPVIAMMPDGYMEPRVEIILTFDSSPISFRYSWDDEIAALIVKRDEQ